MSTLFCEFTESEMLQILLNQNKAPLPVLTTGSISSENWQSASWPNYCPPLRDFINNINIIKFSHSVSSVFFSSVPHTISPWFHQCCIYLQQNWRWMSIKCFLSSSPGKWRCDVLGFVPADHVTSSTFQIWDVSHLWWSLCLLDCSVISLYSIIMSSAVHPQVSYYDQAYSSILFQQCALLIKEASLPKAVFSISGWMPEWIQTLKYNEIPPKSMYTHFYSFKCMGFDSLSVITTCTRHWSQIQGNKYHLVQAVVQKTRYYRSFELQISSYHHLSRSLPRYQNSIHHVWRISC